MAGFDLLGVRIAIKILFTSNKFFAQSLLDRAPIQTTRLFQTTIEQVIHASQQARGAGISDWWDSFQRISLLITLARWRPLEAALAAIGSQSESILDCIEDEQESGRTAPINIDYLLANIIPPILGASGRLFLFSMPNLLKPWTEFPFIQGRGFVFASQFSKVLPLQSAQHYLDAAVQVLELNAAGIPVKISAVKAVHKYVLEYVKICSVIISWSASVKEAKTRLLSLSRHV